MTDKPRVLGDYQSAVDAYVAAGYSKEGAEAALDTHCAIVASHKPPALVPVAAEPELVTAASGSPQPVNMVPANSTEDAAATNWRTEGARRMVLAMVNLCEPDAPERGAPSMPPNLRPTK